MARTLGDRSDRSGMKMFAVVAVIVGGLFAALYFTRHQMLHTANGSPDRAFLVAGRPGPWLVLTDRVKLGSMRSGYAAADRLAAIDISTGKLVNEVPFFDKRMICWPAGEARIWCEDELDRVLLLSVPDFAQLATASELVTKSGRIPAKHMYQANGADLVVTLADGTTAGIDAQTLAVSTSTIAGRNGRPPKVACSTDSSVKLDGGSLGFTGDLRQTLEYRPHQGPDVPVADSATFLKPQMIRVESSPYVLVDHAVSLTDDTQRQLSRLELPEGKVAWTMPMGKAGCEYVVALGDKLIMTTTDASRRAFAVDATTGKLLWQFSFSNR